MAMKLQHRSSPFDHGNSPVIMHQKGVGVGGGGGEPLADLTDLMNDWFFGTWNRPRDLAGAVKKKGDDANDGVKKMSASRQTQQWLEEAKRVIASSPARTGSPSKFSGSPRFAAGPAREPSCLERRDPLSRSAIRRGGKVFSGEILKRHHCNASDDLLFDDHHQHFLLTAAAADDDAPPYFLPPRPSSVDPRRKSRFQDEPQAPAVPPHRAFRAVPSAASADLDARRDLLLSPPRNLVETAHCRTISSSTCSLDKISGKGSAYPGDRRRSVSSRPESAGWHLDQEVLQISDFLRRQRTMMDRISTGRLTAKAKIVLSDSSATCTASSMVATIGYAWLLENREKRDGGAGVVLPVMNMKRARMHKNRQAAWLFHYFGIDGSSLLFSDEVDLEGLIMASQLSVVVTGQDVMNTNNEVGSPCTILTDNYCEDAYDLLQTHNLKMFLLAGILLDTHNLDKYAKFHSHRDVEAIQLLLVGSASSLRQELFEYLIQDHRDKLFLEALRCNYGNPPDNDENGSRALIKKSASSSPQEGKETQMQVPAPVPSPSPAPAAVQTPERATCEKNKFYFAKWFGFNSR